jgi:hypothetical protein
MPRTWTRVSSAGMDFSSPHTLEGHDEDGQQTADMGMERHLGKLVCWIIKLLSVISPSIVTGLWAAILSAQSSNTS